MDMKKATMVALGLAVGFVAGYGTGRVSTGTPINPLSNEKGNYEEGYAAAVKKLEDSGTIPAQPQEIRAMTGTVTAVSEGAITFEANLRTANPLVDLPGPSQRTARITNETKIVVLEQLSPEEMNAQHEAFQKAMAAGEMAPPPSSHVSKPYEGTLKVGDTIRVEASDNILTSKAFDAVTITLLNAS